MNETPDVSVVIDFAGSEGGVNVENDDFLVHEIKRNDKNIEDVVMKENDVVVAKDVVGSATEGYNSMLSMFDDFAADGNRWAVGYGYEIGDMVWGKVKSHPWWPGHIYNEELASPSVRRSKREGHMLVAFFGDSSYGWFELAELIPFEPNFDEKSKQTSSKTFVRAVEEAVDEINRRSWMGLACRCRNPYNFRATEVEGSFAVDVGDNEFGIFSASQIKKARDNYKPGEMLGFMKKLALTPMTDGHRSINFVKHKAAALAYRKAKFEEFDETYAQAFGAHPVRPEAKTAADLQRVPSRAPLSGPLVFAEALGKGKAAAKSAKPKDQVEKDRYLFKRRDEPLKNKGRKAGKGKPPGEPSQLDQGSMPGRETSTSMENQVLQITGVGDTSQLPSDQPTPVTKSIGNNGTKLHAEGTESGKKKSKAKKRPAGKLLSADSVVSEKKKKKRKKEPGVEVSSDHNQVPAVSGVIGASVEKVEGKMIQGCSASELDLKAENHSNDESKIPTAEGYLKEKQREDDAALPSMQLDSMKTEQIDGSRNSEAELRKYITDLRALALDPFHCAERSGPLLVRKVFLKYRCLVYQKSLISLVPAEADTSESHLSKSPSSAEVLDNHPIDHVKETLPVRPLKPPSRPEDPTIGGRKRGSSDRQEEIAAKRKKKITTLKSMAAEKKLPQKAASDAHRGETREGTGKLAALASTNPVRSESTKRTEPAAKLSDPTMLIMKFPPGAALPSLNELKAKFTRFGTLDASKTRIFWQSSQVRLVYLHKKQAESASKFASSVWNTNVRCTLRDLSADASDSGHPKVEDAAVSPFKSGIEQRQIPKLAPQPLQHSSQLKSILKKLPADEGGSISGGGNGSGRGSRVKFVLGGEESSSKTEQLMVGNKNVNNNASFADAAVVSSSTSHAMDFNSKNIQKVISSSSSSQLPSVPLLPSLPLLPPQFPESSNNMLFNEGTSRNTPNFNIQTLPPPPPPPMMPRTSDIDIAQQMISLLTKCNDVVSSLKVTLGYVPYHPL